MARSEAVDFRRKGMNLNMEWNLCEKDNSDIHRLEILLPSRAPVSLKLLKLTGGLPFADVDLVLLPVLTAYTETGETG